MTDNSQVVMFLSGALAMGYAIAALYFLRFWRLTRDRLFAYFTAAFILLLLQRIALSAYADHPDAEFGYYLLRLVAFGLIAFAVVDKNRKGGGKRP